MAPLPLSVRVLRILAKKPASVPTIARETGSLEGDVKRELDKHLTAGRAEVSGSSWMITKKGLAFSSKEQGAPAKALEAANGAEDLGVKADVRTAAKEEREKPASPSHRRRRKPKKGTIAVLAGPSTEALAIKAQLVERGLWAVVEDVARKHGEDPMGLVESQWSRNKVIARSEMFARVLCFEGRRYSKSEVAQIFGRDESVVRDGVQRWAQMQKSGEAAA